MQITRLMTFTSYLTLGTWLVFSGSTIAIAQTKPASPLPTRQATPRSNPQPEEAQHSSSSMTLAPLVAACPFPTIALSKPAANAIGFGELTLGPTEASPANSSNSEDVADAELQWKVNNLVGHKKLDEALPIASKIQGEGMRTQALLRIAEAYADAGQLDKAFRIAQPLPPTSQESFLSKEAVLGKVATAYRKEGQLERALVVASGLKPNIRVSLLQGIAMDYGARKQFQRGDQVLSQALVAWRTSIQDSTNLPENQAVPGDWKFAALIPFASLYLELKQPGKAVVLLDEALAEAKVQPEIPFLVGFNVLSAIPALYATAGRQDKATASLDFVLRTARSYKEPIARSMGLIQVTPAYTILKQPNRVRALLSEATAIAKSDETATHENIIWVSMARTYGSIGQYEQALQAITVVEPISLQEQVKQALICSQNHQ